MLPGTYCLGARVSSSRGVSLAMALQVPGSSLKWSVATNRRL